MKKFPPKIDPIDHSKNRIRLTKFSKPQTKKNIINNNAMMNDNEENSPLLCDTDATVPLSEVTHQGYDDSLSLSSAGCEQPKKVSPNRHC